MKIKAKNVYLALKYQLPLKRFFINFFVTRNAWGLFHRNSHIVSQTGKNKISYGSIESATKASMSMEKKYGNIYRPYKCIFCDGFHIGKTYKK